METETFFKGIFSFKSVDFGNRIFYYFIFLPPHVTNQRFGEVSLCFPFICETTLFLSLCKSESMSCLYSESACMHNEKLSWVAVLYN